MRQFIGITLFLFLAALAAPAFASISASKSFSPASISAGQVSTLTITITNRPPGKSGDLSFTDTYPAGLVNAAIPGVTNTCGGTVTAVPGGNFLALSGTTASLSGNQSCTITVSVTSLVPNTYVNSVTVSSVSGGNAAASASLTVTGLIVGSFNAFESSTPAGAVAGRIYTKLAGAAFSLDVVAISGGAQSVAFTSAVKVELLGNAVTGVALDASNCPVTYTVLQTVSPDPTITAGRSTVNFAAATTAWQDVRVRVSYPAAVPTVVSCSTDDFAIRPPLFIVTSTNATNVNQTGTPMLAAGAPVLNLTATAIAGYNGTPQVDNTQIIGSPVAGTLGGGFSAAPVTTGVAVGNAFSYSEVGNFGFNANAVFDNNFTIVDQPGDCSAGFSNTPSGGMYGCGIGSVAVPMTIGASGFGRFIPDHFETIVSQIAGVPMNCPAGMICPALFNGMVYSGQAFTLNVNAKNALGAVTQNYDSAAGYSRQVTLSAAAAIGGPVSGAGSLTAGATILATSFKTGTTSFGTPAAPVFTFSSAPSAPTNIYLRATDTDGVTSMLPAPNSANSVEGGVAVSSGRLSIANAYGSELLPLPVPVTAQYWNGSGWMSSMTDNATSLNATLVNSSNWTNLTPANWQKLYAASTWGAGSTSVTPATAVFTLVNGAGSFTLAAPGAGNSGSVDMTLKAPTYLLPSNTARATFGVHKGSINLIYQREH